MASSAVLERPTVLLSHLVQTTMAEEEAAVREYFRRRPDMPRGEEIFAMNAIIAFNRLVGRLKGEYK